jgi:HEAT repeat protein
MPPNEEVRIPETNRRRQSALAGHTNDEATARAALSDDAGGVRATAYAALARMERLTAADVERALHDADAVVRRRACVLAVTFDAALVPLLDDDDDLVVDAAAFALGERGGHAGRDAVIALARVATSHDEPLCREAAVAALGAIGDEAGLPAILSATTDKPAGRRRAVLALAPFEGPDVDAALQRALEDRDWQVRQAAEDLLRD